MVPKILDLVSSCRGCPHRVYQSAGQYECEKAGQIIRDDRSIAAFCPLPDFPARRIASLDHTVRVLRGAHTRPLMSLVYAHVLVRFDATLLPDGRIQFDLEGREPVFLSPSAISEVHGGDESVITFTFEQREFRLHPDHTPPLFEEEVKDSILESCFEMRVLKK